MSLVVEKNNNASFNYLEVDLILRCNETDLIANSKFIKGIFRALNLPISNVNDTGYEYVSVNSIFTCYHEVKDEFLSNLIALFSDDNAKALKSFKGKKTLSFTYYSDGYITQFLMPPSLLKTLGEMGVEVEVDGEKSVFATLAEFEKHYLCDV